MVSGRPAGSVPFGHVAAAGRPSASTTATCAAWPAGRRGIGRGEGAGQPDPARDEGGLLPAAVVDAPLKPAAFGVDQAPPGREQLAVSVQGVDRQAVVAMGLPPRPPRDSHVSDRATAGYVQTRLRGAENLDSLAK